jgi:peroxidase
LKKKIFYLDFRPDQLLTSRQLERLALVSGCVMHQLKSNCNEKCMAYRTADGTCNNLKNPSWGASLTALTRWLHAQYENGFNTPRGWNASKLYNGHILPSAREVSARLIASKTITPDPAFSHMLMQWGQFQGKIVFCKYRFFLSLIFKI